MVIMLEPIHIADGEGFLQKGVYCFRQHCSVKEQCQSRTMCWSTVLKIDGGVVAEGMAGGMAHLWMQSGQRTLSQVALCMSRAQTSLRKAHVPHCMSTVKPAMKRDTPCF